MKLILFSLFLALSASSFGQIREEITERFEDGSKKTVITFSGLGNTEKIVKKSFYSFNYLSPWKVETYGSKPGPSGTSLWKEVKIEYYKSGGASKDEIYTYP
jgi:hypothetical protein